MEESHCNSKERERERERERDDNIRWWLGWWWCHWLGCGITSERKHGHVQSIIILSFYIFLYKLKLNIKNLAVILFFSSSLQTIENLQNHLIFYFQNKIIWSIKLESFHISDVLEKRFWTSFQNLEVNGPPP